MNEDMKEGQCEMNAILHVEMKWSQAGYQIDIEKHSWYLQSIWKTIYGTNMTNRNMANLDIWYRCMRVFPPCGQNTTKCHTCKVLTNNIISTTTWSKLCRLPLLIKFEKLHVGPVGITHQCLNTLVDGVLYRCEGSCAMNHIGSQKSMEGVGNNWTGRPKDPINPWPPF